MDEAFEFAAEDGTRLVGTLTRADTAGPSPAALLLNGSGPLDRDSNMPGQALDVANTLAEALAARGVASLRYDKRGVGESSGEYLTTGFGQEASDASRALSALRAAPGVEPARLVAVGHSVGATIAIGLAAADPRLAGVVLLAGSSQNGADVMRVQSDRIAASMGGASRLFARWFLRRQKRIRERLFASTGDVERVGREQLPARWFREYMAHDPTDDLRAIRCPMLAVTGADDLQVEPEDVERMRRTVVAPFEGRTPEGLTHLLRTHDGPPSLASYPAQLEKPMDAELAADIATWTSERLGEHRG